MRAAPVRTARSRARVRESAAQWSGSFRHSVERRPQRFRIMPFAEREESLTTLAMRQIALQDALDGARRILGLHVLVDLAAESRVRPEAAADQHVIAVDRVALLIDRNARRDQPDVADVMLRAGVMTA